MPGFTKTAIMDAFLQLLEERPMERITVQDIVQRCGVSRNTFYYHYGDVYALLEAVFRRDVQRFRDAHPPGEPATEGLLRLMESVKARQRVFSHIYSSVNHDFLQRFLFQATEEVFMEYIQKTAQGLNISDKDLHFVCYAYQSMLVGIFLNWVRDGMKGDLAGTLEQLHRIFLNNTRHMIESAQRETP